MRVYRVNVTHFPDGSREPGWRPDGPWQHTTDFTRAIGTRTFAWPSTRRTFFNAHRAHTHARLLESFGAVVEVRRSHPIEWDTAEPKPSESSERSCLRARARTRAGAES